MNRFSPLSPDPCVIYGVVGSLPPSPVEKLPVGAEADFVVVTKYDKELPSDRLVRLGFGKKIPTDGLGVYYRWSEVPHRIKKSLKLR